MFFGTLKLHNRKTGDTFGRPPTIDVNPGAKKKKKYSNLDS